MIPLSGLPLSCVENLVADKLESITMKTVSPRPRYYVHHRPRVLSVFCAVVAGLNTEFLQSVRHREGLIDVGILVNVVAAVERIADHVLPRAVGCNRHRSWKGLG